MSSFDDSDNEATGFAFAMPPSARQQPGQVRFDDRGNAIYEWTDARLKQDDERAEKLRNKALSYEGLSLVDDHGVTTAPVANNQKGLRVGYNPYESGLLAGKPAARHRNMRELSKWIEMKRLLEQQKNKS